MRIKTGEGGFPHPGVPEDIIFGGNTLVEADERSLGLDIPWVGLRLTFFTLRDTLWSE